MHSKTLFVLLYWLSTSLLVGFLFAVFVCSRSRTRSLDVFKVGEVSGHEFALLALSFIGHLNSPYCPHILCRAWL